MTIRIFPGSPFLFSPVGYSMLNQAVGLGLVKWKFGCWAEGTLIDRPEGVIPVTGFREFR
ncbi:MAG: hypothetical protein ACSHYF_08290 [Verrucomicrobiaceae bacterium]